MPPLTWRNVDAPSFAGSLDGLRTASTMLGNATRSGIDMIDTFKQTNEEAADRAILNRAMAIDDPAAYAAAKANGTLVGADGSNASLGTLRELDKRPDMLLNRAVTQQNYDQTGWVNNRTRDRDARWTAAASDIALANTLARDNNQAGLTKLLSTSATLRALDPDQLAGIFTGADALTNSAQVRSDWDTKARHATDVDTSQQEWNTISRDNATLGDVQQAINARASSLTPGAFANLVTRARSAGYNVNAPIGDANSITTPSSSSPSAGSTTSTTLMGRFIDGLAKLETAGGSKTVKGPAGEDSFNLFNIKDFSKEGTGFRAKDAAEGSNDRYRTYANVEESKADLMKLLANRYPAALQAKTGAEFAKALKDGGYATDPKYVEKLTAAIGDTSGVKDTETVDPASLLMSQVRGNAGLNLGADIVQQQIRERAGQNQAVGIFPELNALQSDRSGASEVADKLTQENGVFRGSNRGEIIDYINYIVQNSGNRINPAMAGQMLARNVQSADNWAERAGSMIADVVGAPFGRRTRTGNLAGGIRLNDQGVYQMMDEYLSGDSSTQLAAQKTLGTESEVITALQNRYNEADALYKQLLAQSKSRPGVAKNLDVYKQKRDAAEQALSRALQSVPNQDTLVPSFNRPVATTRPSRTGSW